MNNNKLSPKRILATAILTCGLLVLLWWALLIARFSLPLHTPATFSVLDGLIVLIIAPLSLWFDFIFSNFTHSLMFERYDLPLIIFVLILSLAYLGALVGMIYHSITRDFRLKGSLAEITAEEFWLRYRWWLLAISCVICSYVALSMLA